MKRQQSLANGWLFSGLVTALLLMALLYDLINDCMCLDGIWIQLEYAGVFSLTITTTLYFTKYVKFLRMQPVMGTEAQRNLLSFNERDRSFRVVPPAGTNNANLRHRSSWKSFLGNSNFLARCGHQWRSMISRETDLYNTPGEYSNKYTCANANSCRCSNTHPINTPSELRQYMQRVAQEAQNCRTPDSVKKGNSPWINPALPLKLLQQSVYQLSPHETTSNPVNTEQHCSPAIPLHTHSQNIPLKSWVRYVANLRMWISSTILRRLVIQIEDINQRFVNHCLADMQFGAIGLERMKQIMENKGFVNQYLPMLPIIVRFLDMCTNQEYLVQRITELAKGYCIDNYLWDSGKNWNDQLPTDSAIIFHLFCVYMDCQLLPLPQSDGGPFYSRYVVFADDECPIEKTIAAIQNRSDCGFLVTNHLRPRFNFVANHKICKSPRDRNNLFCVIIEFLLYMKKNHESILEHINLGKSGINIMCIIDG